MLFMIESQRLILRPLLIADVDHLLEYQSHPEIVRYIPWPERTREQVIEAIGGSVDYASDHLLDTHASRLRLKIKAAGGPRVISAIRGVGYRLIPLH